jgi:adenylate cyclase
LAKVYLARVAWYVGDATDATAQFEEALTEALASEHAPTIANAFWFKAQREVERGDADATHRAADALLDVSEKNGLRYHETAARMSLEWSRARLGAADALARFRCQGEALVNQGALIAPLFHGRLAELQAEQTSVDDALASIDRAIESARAGDIRYIDTLLHRIRGDILLKIDPKNPARAEQAYLAAIAAAREQGARSFGLQAALALAKLYQSAARPIEAHDILAPALEGFTPTPEMPEIAEGRALLEALADREVATVRM